MSRQSELAELSRIYDSSALSNRNLIINGAMQVAQRGTSATHGGAATEDYLSADRWSVNADGGGSQISVDVSTDAPDGFSNSLYISPDASVPTLSGGNRIILKHGIEGQNLSQWAYATASAKPLTLSFWVKSNVTGDVSVVLNTTEICGQTFTINSSNVWEYKSFTFPASVTGSLITYDNTKGLSLDIWLAAGPAFQGTYAGDGVWTTAASTSYTQASNINLYSNTANTFYITGVQLEVGDTATPFEHRSYGDELARCLRYYYRAADGTANTLGIGVNYTTSVMHGVIYFPVTMRAIPTLSAASGTNYYEFIRNGSADFFNSLSLGNRTTTKIGEIENTSEISGTVGHGGYIRTDNSAVYVDFDAEL